MYQSDATTVLQYLRSRGDWPVEVEDWEVSTDVQDGELIVRVLAFTRDMPPFAERGPLREAVRESVLQLLDGRAFWVTTRFAGTLEEAAA